MSACVPPSLDSRVQWKNRGKCSERFHRGHLIFFKTFFTEISKWKGRRPDATELHGIKVSIGV